MEPMQSGKNASFQAHYLKHSCLDLEDTDLRIILDENPMSVFKDPKGSYINFDRIPSWQVTL